MKPAAVAFERRLGRAPAAFAAILCACGASHSTPTGGSSPVLDGGPVAGDGGGAGDSAAPPGRTVSGRVVSLETKRPLPGRSVVTSSGSTMTDGQGLFSVEAPEGMYDAWIVEPDGTTVSLYRGLTIANPVLAHEPSASAALLDDAGAMVQGSLSGGGNYPLAGSDEAEIYFFSAETDSALALGGGSPTAGPNFGPMNLLWSGPDAIAGQVVAFGAFGSTGDAGAPAPYVFAAPLTVAPGQLATIDVVLSSVGTGRLAGTIVPAAGMSVTQTLASFRLPLPHAEVLLLTDESPAAAFDVAVPDMTALGGSYCVSGAASSVTGAISSTTVCGVALGATGSSLSLDPAPAWSIPLPDGGPTSPLAVTPGAMLGWSTPATTVTELALRSASPSAQSPSIFVFTGGASAAWPDLSAIGVVPTPGAAYQAVVGALGPLGSIDEAAGEEGLGAALPTESRRSYGPAQAMTAPAP